MCSGVGVCGAACLFISAGISTAVPLRIISCTYEHPLGRGRRHCVTALVRNRRSFEVTVISTSRDPIALASI